MNTLSATVTRATIDAMGQNAREAGNYNAAMCYDMLAVAWSCANYHHEIEAVVNSLSVVELNDIGLHHLLTTQTHMIAWLTENKKTTMDSIKEEWDNQEWERKYGE